MAAYIPNRGDVVWLQFSPQAGHEQAGLRPAVAISPFAYNQKTKLGLFCPITSQIKGYPFEVLFKGSKINGAVLCDQVKSLDWKVRRAKLIERLSAPLLDEVLAKVLALVDPERA